MCKRTTTDPLLRLLLDRYHLHLLSVPRENIMLGTLYVHDGKQVVAVGNASNLLDPPLDAAAGATSETMADVAGQVTREIDLKAGIGFLDNVLGAMGASAVLDKVHAGLETKRVRSLQFRFTDVTRDSVDVLDLGKRIWRHRLLEEHALFDERNRYYLVTAVARTNSINIAAANDSASHVDLDIDALKAAAANVGVGLERADKGEISFQGSKRLGFGLELHELIYDREKQSLRMKMPDGYIAVRGAVPPRPQPALIGEHDGNVFLSVS